MNYISPPPGVDPNAPLIYMWEIRDANEQVIGRYIGKANGGTKRPTQHYSRNVRKLLQGQPYKKGKNYRRVHFALADAEIAGHTISLSYMCNVPADQNIFEVEMRYIREYRCDADDGVGLNGSWKGERRVALAHPPLLNPTSLDLGEDKNDLDLEDFLEYVQDRHPGQFEIRATPRRYSLWVGKNRILRAYQSGPAGKVYLKLAQSSRNGKPVEFPWDGSDGQLADAIAGELHLLGS